MIKNKVFFFWDTSFANLVSKVTEFFDKSSYNPISSSFQRYAPDKCYASVTAKPIGEPEEPEEAEETEEEKTAEEMFKELGYQNTTTSYQKIRFSKNDYSCGVSRCGSLVVKTGDDVVVLLPKEFKACIKLMEEYSNE